MPIILESARNLTKDHEGSFIRFDNGRNQIQEPARKSYMYRLHRVWLDGINIRKYGSSIRARPGFIGSSRLNQRVQVFTFDEFAKLPE